MKNIFLTLITSLACLSLFGQVKVFTNGDVGLSNTTATPRAFFDIQRNAISKPLANFGMYGIQSISNTSGFLTGNCAWRGSTTGLELYNDGYGTMLQFATNRIMLRMSPQGLAGDAFPGNQLTNSLIVREDKVLINSPNVTNNPSFNLTVWGSAAKSSGGSDWVVFSDKRLKKNIKPYDGGLKEIMKLNPVYFNYNGKANTSTDETYVGLIAQEMEKIAPYAVHRVEVEYDVEEDPTTFEVLKSKKQEYLALDNTSIRYMLVNAVQEQQSMIEELNQKITDLEEIISDMVLNDKVILNQDQVVLEDVSKAIMSQNVPNPFEGFTTINYVIPVEAKSASFNFYNLNGQVIKSVSIENRGNGSLNLNAEDLPSGTYSYSLYVDSKLISTKRMILTK